MAGASRDIEMGAKPETVFQIVTDYESYPDFIDEIREAEILQRGNNFVHCRFVAEIASKRISYTLKLEHTPFERTRWSLLEGDLKKNNGGWDFRPLGNGRTHVTYNVEIDIGLFVPKFILNTLVGANMPKMLEAVRQRAEAADRKA